MVTETIVELRKKLAAEFDADHPASTIVLARTLLVETPDHVLTLTRLGHALSELANYEEAATVLKHALECCEESRRDIIYGKLGHLAKFRGEYDVAVEWYQKAIDAAPNDATGYIFLGAVLARQGKLREAEIIHRRVTQCIDGCIDEAYHNLGLVLRGQGRLKESLECFAAALQMDADFQVAREAFDDVTAAIQYIAQCDT